MLLEDDILKYVPLGWAPIHPLLYKEALLASARRVVEIRENDGEIYWRRNVDDPQLELGL